jgi:hypothetical protein
LQAFPLKVEVNSQECEYYKSDNDYSKEPESPMSWSIRYIKDYRFVRDGYLSVFYDSYDVELNVFITAELGYIFVVPVHILIYRENLGETTFDGTC